MTRIVHPITFIDKLVRFNELGQPFRLMPHQREILRLAFDFDEDGRLSWDTLLYSCVKKSGKTTVNAAVTLCWALTQEAPNELLILANDREQALSRVFAAIEGLIRYNEPLKRECEVQSKVIYCENGTEIKALSSEYSTAAGSNHGLSSWDELWAYTSEGSRRLWEELTPVPTRRNSIRFISTYAGFTNESTLLEELYRQAVIDGERLHPELPIYGNRQARVFAYWDGEPRMAWQTEAYYESQRRTLRPATFQRLHRNEWTSSESRFVEPEVYDACVEPGLREDLTGSLFVGVDVGLKSDSTAVVAVKFDRHSDRLVTAGHRIWQPKPGEILDLGSTLEFFIRGISQRATIVKLLYDPSQAQRSMQLLREMMWSETIEEFTQTQNNLSTATQTLYDCLMNKQLRIYPAADLRTHVLNASAKETERFFRLTKENAKRKIDAAVALSFAVLAAVQNGRPVDFDKRHEPTFTVNHYFDPRVPFRRAR